MNRHRRSRPPVDFPTDPARLREEISYLEARLRQLGYDGDCAYERSMVRFFEQQIGVRQERLQSTQLP